MNQHDSEALRQGFIAEIRARLIGPAQANEELQEKPNKRYLTGMIFPKGASTVSAIADEEELVDDASIDDDPDEPESPMDMLFQKLPASVGLTFAISETETKIGVALCRAKYERVASVLGNEAVSDSKAGKTKTSRGSLIWRHVPLVPRGEGETVELPADFDGRLKTPISVLQGRASLHLFIRRAQGARIATVSLVNERVVQEDAPIKVEDILFQVGMKCIPSAGVPAYPDPSFVSVDLEAEELALQYRALPTFAVGHGCGVDWPDPISDVVSSITVDFLPAVEVPPVTTDIESLPDSIQDALSLVRLQDPNFDPFPAFVSFVEIYRQWRDRLSSESAGHLLGRWGAV